MGELLARLCVAVWLCAAPASFPPIESSVGTADNEAARDERGTQTSPLVVKVIPGFETEAQEHEARSERREKAESESSLVKATWWIFYVTLLLFVAAAIQAGLFVWQLRLMRAEFNATHRPKIILRDATSEQHMGDLVAVNFILANVGDATARIDAAALRVSVFEGFQFGPDNLPEIGTGKSDIESVTLKPGEQVGLFFKSSGLRWDPHNNTCHTFDEPERGMFFSGQIAYVDASGIRRHTGFRRRFFMDQHRYVRVSREPHYEYED